MVKRWLKALLIIWYIATGLCALFLIVTLPFAIHSPLLRSMNYPVIDVALQDLVAIVGAIFLPAFWRYSKERWLRFYQVIITVSLAILIVSFIVLDIQYTF